MSFGSLDQLRARLSIEESHIEKARSDLRQSKAAYINIIAKINLINQIHNSDITFIEHNIISLGTISDGAQASS